MTKRDRQLAEYRAERFFLSAPRVEDRLVVCFEDESCFDSGRRRVRRGVGGFWERGGFKSYMAFDEWETLDLPESRRLEAEYQRLVKAGKVEDIDEMPERPEWISVEVRLPEVGQEVLTLGSLGRVIGYLSNRASDRGVWCSCHCDNETGEPWLCDPGTVTHWMPLPKPAATVEDLT
jgi:hypothetical protein